MAAQTSIRLPAELWRRVAELGGAAVIAYLACTCRENNTEVKDLLAWCEQQLCHLHLSHNSRAKELRGQGKLANHAALRTLSAPITILPLKQLFLGGNPNIGAQGTQLLCQGLSADSLPFLVYLNLAQCNLGDLGASALATALGRGALPKLERLRLAGNGVGDDGLAALAAEVQQRQLRPLELAIRQREGLENLVPVNLSKQDCTLELDGNTITDAGVSALVRKINQEWLRTGHRSLKPMTVNELLELPIYDHNRAAVQLVSLLTRISTAAVLLTSMNGIAEHLLPGNAVKKWPKDFRPRIRDGDADMRKLVPRWCLVDRALAELGRVLSTAAAWAPGDGARLPSAPPALLREGIPPGDAVLWTFDTDAFASNSWATAPYEHDVAGQYGVWND